MKKSILIALASFFIVITLNAQISKGSVFLGGSLTFISASGTKPVLYISPALGKVSSDNTVIGVLINYTSGSPYSNYSFSNYGGGFFARKYKPLGKSLYLFGQGQLTYNLIKQKSSADINNIQSTKEGRYSLGFFPGISYGISRKFYVEATLSNLVLLSYSKKTTENSSMTGTTEYTETSFIFTTYSYSNLPLTLGFHFLL